MSAPPPPPKEEIKVVEEESVYFVAVEEMPFPIGGVQAILNLVVYPEIARRAGIEGKVYVLAYVNEEGTVTKTEILKGVGGGCDNFLISLLCEFCIIIIFFVTIDFMYWLIQTWNHYTPRQRTLRIT